MAEELIDRLQNDCLSEIEQELIWNHIHDNLQLYLKGQLDYAWLYRQYIPLTQAYRDMQYRCKTAPPPE